MEPYKMEDFDRDYPGQPFPPFQHVDPLQCLAFRTEFARRVGLSPDADPLTLLESLEARSALVGYIKPEEQGLDLAALLNSQNVKVVPGQSVYIDWMRFDDTDRMRLSDVSRYFGDIWYSDDISLFDDTLSWMMFMFHYKAVTLVKF